MLSDSDRCVSIATRQIAIPLLCRPIHRCSFARRCGTLLFHCPTVQLATARFHRETLLCHSFAMRHYSDLCPSFAMPGCSDLCISITLRYNANLRLSFALPCGSLCRLAFPMRNNTQPRPSFASPRCALPLRGLSSLFHCNTVPIGARPFLCFWSPRLAIASRNVAVPFLCLARDRFAFPVHCHTIPLRSHSDLLSALPLLNDESPRHTKPLRYAVEHRYSLASLRGPSPFLCRAVPVTT